MNFKELVQAQLNGNYEELDFENMTDEEIETVAYVLKFLLDRTEELS
jgi:hypothetical protein